MNKFKVLSVLQVLGQPRHAKRITMLQEAGFSVEAIAFEREYHKGRIPPCKTTILCKIDHGKYLRRIIKMLIVLPKIRSAITRNDIIYASGQDVALMSLIAGLGTSKPIVMEVGDIRRIQVVPGCVGFVIRCLDWIATKRYALIVATAHGFIDQYYRKFVRAMTPALIIENKLEEWPLKGKTSELEILKLKGVPIQDRQLVIGYFGLLRCQWSWDVLEQLARDNPDTIRIVIAGHPIEPSDLPEKCKKVPNIQYLGQYQSPGDLDYLYNNVDLIWGCYPCPKEGDLNWRWARTNRFYESCFFRTPIIVLAGSGDATYVESNDIGLVVPSGSVKHAALAIADIDVEKIHAWEKNMASLPRSTHTYTTEGDELKRALMKIANR